MAQLLAIGPRAGAKSDVISDSPGRARRLRWCRGSGARMDAFSVAECSGAQATRARADSERNDRLRANEAVEPLDVDTVALDRSYGSGRSNRLDVFTPRWPGGRPTATVNPTREALPTFVWVHGGGFIGGTKDDARSWLKLVAAEGFTTVGMECTLAPAGRYPTQVEEVASAVRHVVENAEELGVDPTRIVLGGDSAGAHISGQHVPTDLPPVYVTA